MPTERFNSCEREFADLLVDWPTQDELNDAPPGITEVPYVDLFPCAPTGYSGGIYFGPDDESKAKMGLGEDAHGIGPVRIKFDRASVNRLITTLRQARDEAFGADA